VSLAERKEDPDFMSNLAQAAEVFSQHGNFIRSVIRYRTANDDLTEDLFQDFFLTLVFKPIPSDVDNIKSYLSKALANDAFDAEQRMKTYKGRINRYSRRNDYADSENNPEKTLMAKEEMENMFEIINQLLPPYQSQAVTLKFKHDHSVTEVARQMAIDKRTVSKYISIGLRKLRFSAFGNEEKINV
jgi:RNA polymerase sigma factor (sigma-70 family)